MDRERGSRSKYERKQSNYSEYKVYALGHKRLQKKKRWETCHPSNEPSNSNACVLINESDEVTFSVCVRTCTRMGVGMVVVMVGLVFP